MISFANSIKSKILLAIILFIGFQQFPVLHVGGSLKIYEVLGGALLLMCGIRVRQEFLVKMMYVFFVISPILSLISFYICDDVESYYSLYPTAKNSFRYNIYVFPLLQLLFMCVNYVVLYNVYYNRVIYEKFEILIKWIVIIGTIIACYSIVAMFTGDPISHLPNFMQNKHVYDFRSSGLSQEPSSYVLYQGWNVILYWHIKHSFTRIKWIIIFGINVISLLFTFSSTLVLFVGIICLMIFFFSRFQKKLIYLSIFCIFLYTSFLALSKFVDVDLLHYAMVQKVEDFVLGKDDAGGSGGFRHYESSLGWIIFQDNPIFGVGVGNSNYFMHIADKKSPIIPLDEQLEESSFPPNTFSCVFAEQGIIGGGAFVMIIFLVFHRAWKFRKYRYGKAFLTAIVYNIGCFLLIAPQYSMYLWLYLFIAIGYYRNVRMNLMLNDENSNRL